MTHNWAGQKVLIIGAARQGLSLARYLAARGAQVTLNDQHDPAQLGDAVERLADLPITWALGSHPLELLDHTDVVCVSGGVPLSLPLIVEARRRGLPLTNDSQIMMDAIQAPVIGITGSAGKTTTTTLVGRMADDFATQTGRKAWVGGNIGLPLVEFVDQIRPDDLVVVEFSSFQLELMTTAPHLGAVLNITPNHLDRHGTLEAYTAAKARILQFQSAEDIAVLNREDPGAWNLVDQVRGSLVTFGLRKPESGAGTFFQDEQIYFGDGQRMEALMSRERIRLRGEHNLLNVLAASAIACAAGFPADSIRAGVSGFNGVPHRLEYISTCRGADWYNDSIATAPERTIADILVFDEPLVLLLGGRDKNLPWEKLADLVRQRVDHVIVFGEASEKILQALGPLQAGQRLQTIHRQPGLHSAVQDAADLVEPGDVVLFAPGGTSFDEFKDFEERGERFREWVKALS
ncbi:MAG TPA: UDP-N-acetylmuramoyl-L-alanine--D-glutamate ligase [Anaerolineaceae bacterium]